jgi:hypothetical protein
VAIQFLGQLLVIVFLVQSDFYVKVDSEAYKNQIAKTGESNNINELPVESMETTSLFFFTNTLLIGCSMIFAEGHPFKKEFWTNKNYIICSLILFFYMWIQTGVKDIRFPDL